VVEIRCETTAALAEYCTVPAAFDVVSVFDVAEVAGRYALTERPLQRPFTKDYDAIEGNGPLTWPKRFRLDDWGLFSARIDGRWVGAAAVALDADLLLPIGGAPNASVLWDLRVSPAHRRAGVGSALVAAVEEWSRDRNRCQLLAETQNVNTAACRFYERRRCALVRIDRRAYPGFPEEIQLVWRKQITAAGGAG
jgi:GNAT superfamily N-acetyltransferase